MISRLSKREVGVAIVLSVAIPLILFYKLNQYFPDGTLTHIVGWVLIYAIDLSVSGLSLWFATKYMRVSIELQQIFVVIFISSLFVFIPGFGVLVSSVVFLSLLGFISRENFIDIFITTLLAKMLSFMFIFGVVAFFGPL